MNILKMLLIFVSFTSNCGIEEKLKQAASCQIDNFEETPLSVCQDYGTVDIVKILALNQACSQYGGTFNEGTSCVVRKDTIGCFKTVSYSGFSLDTLTWFNGVVNQEFIDPSILTSCDSVRIYKGPQ